MVEVLDLAVVGVFSTLSDYAIAEPGCGKNCPCVADDALSITNKGLTHGTTGPLGAGKLMSACMTNAS